MQTFTKEEVIKIISNIYEHYNITSLDKFQERFSEIKDPDNRDYEKAELEDIESFII